MAFGDRRRSLPYGRSSDERFRELMAEGRNTEAEAVARDVVNLTQQLHGENSVELASAYTNLATAQLRLKFCIERPVGV